MYIINATESTNILVQKLELPPFPPSVCLFFLPRRVFSFLLIWNYFKLIVKYKVGLINYFVLLNVMVIKKVIWDWSLACKFAIMLIVYKQNNGASSWNASIQTCDQIKCVSGINRYSEEENFWEPPLRYSALAV